MYESKKKLRSKENIRRMNRNRIRNTPCNVFHPDTNATNNEQ